jgi:hypothetical protein
MPFFISRERINQAIATRIDSVPIFIFMFSIQELRVFVFMVDAGATTAFAFSFFHVYRLADSSRRAREKR